MMIEINFINNSSESSWRHYRQYLNLIAVSCTEVLDLKQFFSASVILVDEDEIHVMNRDYRNKDQATDVISFAAQEGESFAVNDALELGDIFINVSAIRKQAHDYGHSLKREFCFLVTHGLLHLLGYDHLEKEEELEMFRLQEEILYEIAPR